MTAVRVFDPAMCCSTGICGPAIDPELARFAADLDWLKAQGVAVERFNLAQQPGAFAEDAEVKVALGARGEASLPLVKVNGEVKSSGVYPTRDTLAAWAGLSAPAAEQKDAHGAAESASVEVAAAKPGGCCGGSSSSAGAKKSGCC